MSNGGSRSLRTSETDFFIRRENKMVHYIIKLKQYYYLQSSVVDAPITDSLDIDQLTQQIKIREGEEGLRKLPARLKRVEEKGTSAFNYSSVEELIACNRAGENENHLSMDELIKEYQ